MPNKCIYEEWFGIEPVITPGFAWNTGTGGGYLCDEVLEAMIAASKHKVPMQELALRAGEVVADILGVEAAFITSSDCAAMALAAAAMMTGEDEDKMDQLPDTEYPQKLKNEIICQFGMTEYYMRAFRVPGAKLIRVGGKQFELSRSYDPVNKKCIATSVQVSADEIEEVINERTAGIVAAVHACQSLGPPATVPVSEVVKVAKKYNLPVIVDSPHPPVAGGKKGLAFLKQYIEMGVDLVTLSGGKAVDGPNSTGILYGKKELVEAAAMQGAPGKAAIHRFRLLHGWQDLPTKGGQGRTPFGRGYKVSRELIVGFVAALKRYVSMDSEAVTARDTRICEWMAEELRNTPHVKAVDIAPECDWPKDNMFEGGISCIIDIDEEALGKTVMDIPDLVWEGVPHVVITRSGLVLAPWGKLQLFSHGLRDGEEKIVIERLKKALSRKYT